MNTFTSVGRMTDKDFDDVTYIILAEDIAEERGIDLYGYNALQQSAKAKAEKIEATISVDVPKQRTRSKKAIAIDLYNALDDKSRSSFISALVDQGFGKATASTYYYNISKGIWS